jgi:hypothetical protein
LAVQRASGPVLIFCVPVLILCGTEGVGSVFMFCAPGLLLGGTKGVRSTIHVLRTRTYFRRYRGCVVQYSFFALPDTFLAKLRVRGPIFMFCVLRFILGGPMGVISGIMFCALGFVFGGTEGAGPVLRSLTHFLRY